MKMGKFEFNLNHFFRYVYGGFILCLIMLLILPEQAKQLYNALGGKDLQGNMFFIFLFVAIGTGLYAFYKVIINEFLIDKAHFKKPELLLGHPSENCVFKYLVSLGVEEKHRLTAFRLIRGLEFNPMIRKIFYLRHSETHVLYITTTVCAIGLLVRFVAWWPLKISACNIWVSFLILIVGIISFLAGLFCDGKICADECSYCKLIEEKIKNTLQTARLLQK